jgi:peptide/nickel transport system substrate-binding protein
VNGKCVLTTLGVLVSCVLILASCGSGATTSAPATTVKPATTSAASTTTAPVSVPPTTSQAADKPKYGGTFVGWQAADTAAFDCATQWDLMGFSISITNEPLLAGDWAKGPAGTGETDWQFNHLGQTKTLGGQLAEGYEITAPDTIVWHIRQGVKWWNKPPANGREFTADDVVWNLKTQWANPGGNFAVFFPAPEEKLIDAKTVDKYTVEIKFKPGRQGIQILETGARAYMMLPELHTGGQDQKDWKNALGTGAFMLTDWAPMTSMTLKKNPDYWQKDPVGPGKGNKLPYIDALKILIIPDLSTREAAFRTGKIDHLTGVVTETFTEMQKSMNWKLEYKQGYGTNSQPEGREDKPNLPFKDIKVRQAMNLAVDKVAIARDYYQGKAEVMGFPYPNGPGWKPYYTPLEQLTPLAQEIVKGGNVQKAKQFLKEAGYPNGFKTEIACTPADVDVLSIVKADLIKAGIDMELKVYEVGVWRNQKRGRTFAEMLYNPNATSWMPHYMFEMRPETADCVSYWDSPETRAVYKTIQDNLGIDDTKWSKSVKDITSFVLESSFGVWLPIPYAYQIWQPWVKNYYGAINLGAYLPYHHTYYNWIDVDLKDKVLGR